MPIIQADILEGRTIEQKRDLAKKLTEAVIAALGVKPEAIRVLIRENKPEHWARGGVLISDEPK
ncbi:MAG TPA: 2-hydroxymuconate tautomerase, partial [Bacillota bacterium]